MVYIPVCMTMSCTPLGHMTTEVCGQECDSADIVPLIPHKYKYWWQECAHSSYRIWQCCSHDLAAIHDIILKSVGTA